MSEKIYTIKVPYIKPEASAVFKILAKDKEDAIIKLREQWKWLGADSPYHEVIDCSDGLDFNNLHVL